MKKLIPLITLACFFAVSLMSCDVTGEESFDFEPGDSLNIVGPAEVAPGETASYYVQAFTIQKEYTWTVNGEEVESRREGEYIDVTFDAAGTYTIAVDDNEEYAGTLEVTAESEN